MHLHFKSKEQSKFAHKQKAQATTVKLKLNHAFDAFEFFDDFT